MQLTIKKWGNSAAFRIPAALLQEAHLHIDQAVEARVEDGRLIIEPSEPELPVYDLKGLLAGVRPEQVQPETPTGSALGAEILPDEDLSGAW